MSRRTSGVAGTDMAKLCFSENITLFGNAKTQPEKFNLYKGLYNLAVALEQTQAELQQLRQEVALLRQGR